MKKIFTLVSIASAALFAVSCASADQMAKDAENVIVNCNPSPLAVKGGKIDADVTVTYPEKYFNPKAILEVTPVIVYEGGEEALPVLTYQGEKVQANHKVVPAAGGQVKEHFTFPYKEGMAKSTFELRGRCTVDGGKKWVDLPVKKAADGCNVTETLLCTKGAYEAQNHGYQAVIPSSPEGQVLYAINSSSVRNSQISGQSVKDFKKALQEALANERKEIKNIEVVAYASPDGPESLNTKLSDSRSKSAEKAFKQVTRKEAGVKGIATDVKSIGEDWNGFKDLVGNSDIDDKELILRVLGMYSDSNVREKEIKNMASVYQELAKDILPQLRRARFIANVEFTNYSEEELKQLFAENVDILDEPALLKTATIFTDKADKLAAYNKAVEKFNSAKAKVGIVCVYLDNKDLAAAKKAIEACDANDADVVNLKGVIALREKDFATAKSLFAASGSADAGKNLGTCAISEGDYALAARKCGDKGFNAALANLLNGDAAAALNCLGDCDCACTNYLRAICYARQGKAADAKAALKKATDADATLAKRAETDIEFATIR